MLDLLKPRPLPPAPPLPPFAVLVVVVVLVVLVEMMEMGRAPLLLAALLAARYSFHSSNPRRMSSFGAVGGWWRSCCWRLRLLLVLSGPCWEDDEDEVDVEDTSAARLHIR